MVKKTIEQLFNLTGKTAVVTGGAKGIGFGIVERLIEAGANVVIADIADGVGEAKAKKLGAGCVYVHCDVSIESDVAALIKKTLDSFGSLDIFVNNAGIFPGAMVLDMDVALWEKIQNINLKGTFLCSRAAGAIMAERGGGVFVNIASIDALHPSSVGLASYDASKHGMWGFTKNFALEVASKNIRVNAIAPGGIATEGVEEMTGGTIKTGDATSDVADAFSSRIPMKRRGLPDDIATVALFLTSDAARYITGEIIVVDGGYLLS